MPPLKLPSKYKFGDLHSIPHINLPMKKVQPFPFRHGIETLTYKDNSSIIEELGMLNDTLSLLTLKTSQKYFQPQNTYPQGNYS